MKKIFLLFLAVYFSYCFTSLINSSQRPSDTKNIKKKETLAEKKTSKHSSFEQQKQKNWRDQQSSSRSKKIPSVRKSSKINQTINPWNKQKSLITSSSKTPTAVHSKAAIVTINEKDKQIAELQKKFAEQNIELERVKEENKQLKTVPQKINQTIKLDAIPLEEQKKLQDQVTALNKINKDLEDKIIKKEEELQKLMTSNNISRDLESEMKKTTEEIITLKKQIEKYQQKEAAYNEKNTVLLETQRNNKQCKEKLEELEKNLEEKETETNNALKELESNIKLAQRNENNLIKTTQENESLKKSIDENRKKTEKETQQYKTTSEKLQEDLIQKNMKIEKLEKEIEDSQNATLLNNAKNQLTKVKEEMESSIQVEKEKSKALNETITNLNKEIETLKKEIKKHEIEKKTMDKYKDFETEKKTLDKQIEQLTQQNTALEEQNREQRKSISQNAELNLEITKMKKAINEKQPVNDTMIDILIELIEKSITNTVPGVDKNKMITLRELLEGNPTYNPSIAYY